MRPAAPGPPGLPGRAGLPGLPDRFQRRVRQARVHVRAAHHDAVPAGVGDQRLGRVEAHRLRPQQPREERVRVIALEEGAGEDQVGEAQRVALREPVAGEGPHPVENTPGRLLVHPVARGALQEAPAQPLHPPAGPFRPHRVPQLVGLGGGEVRDVERDLHQLFLEQRHAQGLVQRVRQQRMVVFPVLPAGVAADVGVHGPALDRTGADERHLDGQVVERPRRQPRQGRQLRTALHLEHAEGVGAAQHRVHLVVVQVQVGQVDVDALVRGHQIQHVVQRGQHAQPEQVELDQSHGGTVVLLPLQDAASGHPRPLDRDDLAHRPVADDHAARVDPQVPGEVLQ